jgi:membrane associated rhomboid family serine protease
VGASGAEFGLIACLVVDLYQHWKLVPSPKTELAKLVVLIGISIAIGFAPGLDNFSHIGGFFMGLLVGLVVMPGTYLVKWDYRRKLIAIAVATPLIVIFYVLLLVPFYNNTSDDWCNWCKNLSYQY